MNINVDSEVLQRLQNIASMKGISLQEALKLSVHTTYYFCDRKSQGFKILLHRINENGTVELKEVIKL